MPSKVNGDGVATAGRFELPVLDLNFGSITDGTSIPPPPDSPVHKPAPALPSAEHKEATKENGTNASNGAAKVAATNGKLAGIKRRADDVPLRSSVSSRPGSLRRLFSRTKLNSIYAEGQTPSNGNEAAVDSRPVSRSGGSIMDERKSKRSSGWFRRLRTADASSRRASVMTFQEKTAPVTNRSNGPPPPMIPELTELEKDEGSLGSDLFKNIN